MLRTVPLLFALTAALPAAPPEKAPPLRGELAALRDKLQEKLNLAKKLYDESASEVERGLVEPGELIFPSQLLLAAELPLCATPADQIKAHERHLAVLKRCEDHFRNRYEQRRVPFQTYAQVQLARMDEEIAILTIKTRLPPPKPAG
jgi:hypothetical protein